MFHQTSWKDKITVGEKIDHNLCWCTWQKPSKIFTLREPSALLRQVACAGYLQDDVWVMPIQTASSSEAKEAILQLQRTALMLYSPVHFRRPDRFTHNVARATWPLIQNVPPSQRPPANQPSCKCSGRAAGDYWEGRCASPSWLTQATFTVVSRCQ